MLQALISLAPMVAPAIMNVFKKKVREKAPEPVKQAIDEILSNQEIEAELNKELLNLLSKYNEQILRELEIRERSKTIDKLTRSVRPILTFGITAVFNITLLAGLFTGKASFQDYLSTLAPINSMLIGFWFGERSALKDPRKSLTEE